MDTPAPERPDNCEGNFRRRARERWSDAVEWYEDYGRLAGAVSGALGGLWVFARAWDNPVPARVLGVAFVLVSASVSLLWAGSKGWSAWAVVLGGASTAFVVAILVVGW
jgi:hypothetical protein